MIKFCEVIISVKAKEIDRAFTYKISNTHIEKAQVGMRVLVPFGRLNKKTEGFIVNVLDDSFSPDFEESKIKEVISFLDDTPMFDATMLDLAKWMKEKYYTTLFSCLKALTPSGVGLKNEYVYNILPYSGPLTKSQKEIYSYIEDLDRPVFFRDLVEVFSENIKPMLSNMVKMGAVSREELIDDKDYIKKQTMVSLNLDAKIEQLKGKQLDVVSFLEENGKTLVSELKNTLDITDSPIRTLAKKGIVSIDVVEIRRNTVSDSLLENSLAPKLNEEQAQAVKKILNFIDTGNLKPVLLRGVTGSGKTEVYLRLIEETLNKGKSAIVLVPEISLTPQTVSRFITRFPGKVTLTHSRLSFAERYDQWKNAKENKVSVMIGPRSAIFAPFDNLGIIIIDEEHETSYKSDITPKFDAREVAVRLSDITGAALVLGSATPSMESYFKTQNGEYNLITLNNRVNGSFPDVNIIDMRKELLNGNKSIFSEELFVAMKENIENNKQTILFLNRRGHSTFVSCRQCGYVMTCEDCNINYTYHIYNDKLVCHYCNKRAKNPENCPQCGSKYIKYFGVGTQRIEDEVKRLFPDVSVLRMDMDTTTRKHSHETILKQFKTGQAKILIGTQMIAKGLDFPLVTLVGVVAADISLNAADYKSGEQTFQLLTQVAGRAGRADYKGKVYIQTYNPEHYAVLYSKDNDYETFFEHELALRRQMNYPPFSHVFTILFTCESEKKTIQTLFKLKEIFDYFNKKNDFEILGPSPAFVSKIKKRYRWKIIVKATEEERLKNYCLYCVEKLKTLEDVSDININLTLNPLTNV